jgi:hypothetical protein
MTVRQLVKRASTNYPYNSLASRGQIKYLRRSWIAAIRSLGNKWVLNAPQLKVG